MDMAEQREHGNAEDWATGLFGGAKLGDLRRTRQAVEVSATLAAGAGLSLPKMAGGNSARYEQVARFTRNKGTDPFELLRAGCDATARKVVQSKGDIIVAGDTTTLSYSHDSILKSLGHVGGPKDSRGRGILVHNALAVSPENGEVLGLLDQMYACRDDATYGHKHERKQRTYEEKESFKWEASFRAVWERLQDAAPRLVFVNDREADVYNYVMVLIDEGARFVVRGEQDRRLETSAGRLDAAVANAPVQGHARVFIGQKGGRPARTTRVALSACTVTILPPQNALEVLPPLTVNVVLVNEVDPPEGEQPVSWTLLTREPVESLDALLRVVTYYNLRWPVEEFHKCWKSDGTNVEALRMQTRDNLLRIAVPMAFVAVRIMTLRDEYLGEQFRKRLPQVENRPEPESQPRPVRPCTYVLTDFQWQVLWILLHKDKPIPREGPPDLSWAMRGIAKLGGWLDTKRTGRPGYPTLWQGWRKLDDAVDVARLAQHLRIDTK
jgi:hypothetical protein